MKTSLHYNVVLLLGACDADAPQSNDIDMSDPIGEEGCEVGFAVGSCPPDFTLVDPAEEAVSLSEFVGRPTLVVAAAEW